jgi:hypothetical protein
LNAERRYQFGQLEARDDTYESVGKSMDFIVGALNEHWSQVFNMEPGEQSFISVHEKSDNNTLYMLQLPPPVETETIELLELQSSDLDHKITHPFLAHVWLQIVERYISMLIVDHTFEARKNLRITQGNLDDHANFKRFEESHTRSAYINHIKMTLQGRTDDVLSFSKYLANSQSFMYIGLNPPTAPNYETKPEYLTSLIRLDENKGQVQSLGEIPVGYDASTKWILGMFQDYLLALLATRRHRSEGVEEDNKKETKFVEMLKNFALP